MLLIAFDGTGRENYTVRCETHYVLEFSLWLFEPFATKAKPLFFKHNLLAVNQPPFSPALAQIWVVQRLRNVLEYLVGMKDSQLTHKDLNCVLSLALGMTFGWVSTPAFYFIICEMNKSNESGL